MDDNSNLLLKTGGAAGGKRSKLAVASFVSATLSLIGLLLGSVVPGFVFLFLFFILAIVTGHLARRAFRREPGTYANESWATYGLAIGYFGLALSLIAISLLVVGE